MGVQPYGLSSQYSFGSRNVVALRSASVMIQILVPLLSMPPARRQILVMAPGLGEKGDHSPTHEILIFLLLQARNRKGRTKSPASPIPQLQGLIFATQPSLPPPL